MLVSYILLSGTAGKQIKIEYAGVAELADAQASGACGRKIVWVQVPSPAFSFCSSWLNRDTNVCRSGGIGRRAGFRCLWSQDRVGSSPISCIFFCRNTETIVTVQLAELLQIIYCSSSAGSVYFHQDPAELFSHLQKQRNRLSEQRIPLFFLFSLFFLLFPLSRKQRADRHQKGSNENKKV